MGVVDVVVALNSELRDVAILQQQRTSSQQPEIVGNTNINNENQERVGDDSVNNATWQARESSHTGHRIMTRTGTGKVAGYNEPRTENCPGLTSVPTITYLWEELALRDAKIVAMEQRMSQLFHTVRGLQQRWWQPMLFIHMPERQQQIKPLWSYTMSPQGYNDKWSCTSLTANDESQFSSGKDEERVSEEESKDNTTTRDRQLQQYNASTPQARRTRRRKVRDEEEQIARQLKRVQSTKHPEGNTTAEKGSPYYRNFPESRWRNIHHTDSDSHANAGLQTLMSSAIQIPSSR